VADLVLYFQVHQPWRLRRQPEPGTAGLGRWFDQGLNRSVLERVAERCYLPANALLKRLIEDSGGAFRCAFSLSGTALQQLEDWAPEALDGFVDLARTGAVEFLSETSHHTLAALERGREFEREVALHTRRIEAVFGRRPTTFRNTELIVDEAIARRVEGLGFLAMPVEGAERLLGGRHPWHLYRPLGCTRLVLLPRHYGFSDDIAFRFSDRGWWAWPLEAPVFLDWLESVPAEDGFLGLYMDYETFGEHQPEEGGILGFLEEMVRGALARERLGFATPAETARRLPVAATLPIPEPVSWADRDRDLGAWLGNEMQREAHRALYALWPAALEAGPEALEHWRRLATSDHVYYMSTAGDSDYDVHAYFSPFDSPRQAFEAFRAALEGLEQGIRGRDSAAAR